MKKLFLITFILTCFSCLGQNNPDRFPDGIGTKLIDPLGNTTAEINAFTNNALGRLAFNTDEGKWKRWDGSAWIDAFSGGSSPEFYTVTGTGANANVQIGSGDYNALIDLDFPTNTITLEYNTLILDNGATVNGGDVIINDINNNEVGLEIRGSSTAISRSTNIGFSAFDNNSLSSVSLFNDGAENYVGIGKNPVNHLKIKSLIDDGTVGAPKDITVFFPNLTANDTIVVQSKLDAAIAGVDSSIEGITQTGTIGSGDYLLYMGDVFDASAKVIIDEASGTVFLGNNLANISTTATGVNIEGETTINGLTTIEAQTVINEDLYVSGDIEASRIVNLLAPSSDSDAANKLYVDNAIAGVGSGGHTIQSNGANMPTQPNLNFKGAVTLDDNTGNNSTDVTFQITGGFAGNQGYETMTATGGETTWVLSETPASSTNNQLFIGGGADTAYTLLGTSQYSLSGNTLTLSGAAIPTVGDILKFYYAKSTTQAPIQHLGSWTAQNYTISNVVEYNGSSYVCKLNTVSNELPTNTTYWDLVALKGADGVAGADGADGVDGVNGADGVVDGITLDAQFKKVLENISGYSNRNYFNKNDLQDGYIANNTTQTLTPPTTDEKVSGKIYLSAGDYFLFNVSSGIYGYIQLFEIDGTYIRTEEYFSNDLYFQFNMPNDGYVIMDVNRNVTTPIDDIMLTDYDVRFNTSSNIAMVGGYQPYSPYSDDIPNVVYEVTDNKNDASKWVNPSTADAYNTDWYLDVDVTGSNYLSVYDEAGIQSFNNAARPQIIEFDNTDTEIATQTSNQAIITVNDELNWKRWKLNINTTKVRFCIPEGNSVTYGTITDDWIQNNFRITVGDYFTKEAQPLYVSSINGVSVPKEPRHNLFGKTIALFGDSITDEAGTIGSRMSWSQDWYRQLELSVHNYATGSAGLTDWDDTVVVSDGSPSTVSHDNVVSNQIEEMIAKGIVPDIVVITGGTNDSFRGRVKGDLATAISNYDTLANQDKETYYGMFFWAVKRLRDLNPNVQIFLMKPIRAMEEGAGVGLTALMGIVWESYDEVYEVLGVHLIDAKDMLHVLGTISSNDYYEDALHPSVLGKKIMSPIILDDLNKAIH